MLFTWYEWKSHFSSCLWKCPICGKSFKHAREILVHKMHHVRREAKLARLEEEDYSAQGCSSNIHIATSKM